MVLHDRRDRRALQPPEYVRRQHKQRQHRLLVAEHQRQHRQSGQQAADNKQHGRLLRPHLIEQYPAEKF